MGNAQFRNGKVLFVNNKVAMAPACCCDIIPHADYPCAVCPDVTPKYLVATFNGLGDVACDCQKWNGQGITLTEWQSCRWLFDPSPDARCEIGYIIATLSYSTPNYIIGVDLCVATNEYQCGMHAYYRKAQTDPFDCTDFGVLQFDPPASHTVDPHLCDPTGSTCTLVAGMG
jgi:hypothetical protein